MLTQSELIFWTLIAGTLSALTTGLGAIPVHFIHTHSKKFSAFATSISSGMMISASVFSLAQEGISLERKFPLAPYIVIVGLLLGAAFFRYTEHNFSHLKLHKHYLKLGASKKGALIFLVMFIHSIPEGIAIGVAFATGNPQFGLIMSLAIAVHNIPEGITISLPLKADGVSSRRCAFLSVISSIPQPIMAVPSALLAWFFEPLLPIGLGFAGGAMIYLVISEMLPEAYKEGGNSLTAWGVMLGLSGMLLFTTLLNLIPKF